MMNKSIMMISGIAVLLMVSGCKKFLSTLPTDFTSVENFYRTEEELEQALTAVYSTLAQRGTYGRFLALELEHGSDELFYKRNNTTVTAAKYNHDPTDAFVQETWAELYNGINRANLLLANIHRPDMDETARNRIRGEALFLRAFFYFKLVHHWGDIPVYLTPTMSGETVDFPRTDQREVYGLILKDMKEAEELVPPISAYTFSGRITKTTVQGVLARVCLKMAGFPLNDAAKWQEAKYWSSEVIESGEHRLNSNYAQIFKNHTQDIYDTGENIWEVEFAGNTVINPSLIGGFFAKYLSIRNSSEELYGYGFFGPTGIHFKRYDDPNDVRRDRNIATFRYVPVSSGNVADTVAWKPNEFYNRDCGKWRIYEELLSPKNRNLGPTNFPVLRYADVLLMFAEAENEINGTTDSAYWALNEVRKRANAYEYNHQNAPTQEVLRDILREERARELCYEGLRKFDLIRWGIFIETAKLVAADYTSNGPPGLQYAAQGYNRVSERHLYLPIPSRELTLNRSMTQNPEW